MLKTNNNDNVVVAGEVYSATTFVDARKMLKQSKAKCKIYHVKHFVAVNNGCWKLVIYTILCPIKRSNIQPPPLLVTRKMPKLSEKKSGINSIKNFSKQVTDGW